MEIPERQDQWKLQSSSTDGDSRVAGLTDIQLTVKMVIMMIKILI